MNLRGGFLFSFELSLENWYPTNKRYFAPLFDDNHFGSVT